MARNMSFFLTTDQVRARAKTVTRRLGWKFLKVGDELNACVKCQGLKPGEKVEKLARIRVVEVGPERLDAMKGVYGVRECVREGFPGLSGPEFVRMFCDHMRVKPDEEVTRIRFEYLN